MGRLIGPPLAHALTHLPGGGDDLYGDNGQSLLRGSPARVESLPRWAAQTTQTPTGGVCYLNHFVAAETLTVSTLALATGTTLASGLTLARLGLYTVAANGDVTLVAKSASDTTLATVGTNTLQTVAITLDGAGGSISSYALVRGQRYALAFVFVGTTMPTLRAAGLSNAFTALSPALVRNVSGSDLPASVANASLNTTSNLYWMTAY